jgi:hypothetical protein
VGAEEGSSKVQRSGQEISGETADAPVGRDEKEAGLRLQQVVDADSAAEVVEVSATAHADVLTGVDDLSASGVGKGPRATAGALSSFEDGDGAAALSKCGGGGQSSQAGSDDTDALGHGPTSSTLGFLVILDGKEGRAARVGFHRPLGESAAGGLWNERARANGLAMGGRMV